MSLVAQFLFSDLLMNFMSWRPAGCLCPLHHSSFLLLFLLIKTFSRWSACLLFIWLGNNNNFRRVKGVMRTDEETFLNIVALWRKSENPKMNLKNWWMNNVETGVKSPAAAVCWRLWNVCLCVWLDSNFYFTFIVQLFLGFCVLKLSVVCLLFC